MFGSDNWSLCVFLLELTEMSPLTFSFNSVAVIFIYT